MSGVLNLLVPVNPSKRRDRPLEEVGKILPALFRKQLRGAQAPLVELLAPLWPRVVGKGIAAQCRPVSFAGGTLTIATACPTWAAQLRQLSEEIRAETNRFLGSDLIKKLRIRHDPKMDSPDFAANAEALAPSEHLDPGWPGEMGHLEPVVAGVLRRSYSKYFARNNRKVH